MTAKPALATSPSSEDPPAMLAAAGAYFVRRWSKVPPVSGIGASGAVAGAVLAKSSSSKPSVFKEAGVAASGGTGGVRTLKHRLAAPSWLFIVLVITLGLLSSAHGLRLLDGPQDTTEFGGQPATLQCRFDGPANVTWLRDGSIVTYRFRITLLANGSLHFTRLLMFDTATYKCIGQSGDDEISVSAILRVVASPPWEHLVPREPVFTSLRCQDPSAVVVNFTYKDRVALAKYAPVLDFIVEYASNGSTFWSQMPPYLVPPKATPVSAKYGPERALPTAFHPEAAPPTRNFTIVLSLWPSSNYSLRIVGRNRIDKGYWSKRRNCSTPAPPPPMATPPKLKVFPVLLPYGPA